MIIDTAYKIKVMLAYLEGKPVEFLDHRENWEVWQSAREPNWSWGGTVYRVKEPTKPSINWDEVSDEYNWLVRDKGGVSRLFKEQPSKDIGGWWYGYSGTPCECFKSFSKGDCDWEDSLVQRPSKDKGE